MIITLKKGGIYFHLFLDSSIVKDLDSENSFVDIYENHNTPLYMMQIKVYIF